MKKSKKPGVRLPAKWLYNPAVRYLSSSYGKKYNLHVSKENMEQIKPPFVLLSNHCSRLDWIFVGIGARPHYLNAVVTRYYYSDPKLGFFLRKVGAIPKDQFAPDVAAIKSMLATAKLGGNIMIFPEGRTTPSGSSETFERSTVKLLRHLGLPVVAMHLYGAYLSYPKWASDMRPGKVELTVKPIMTPEEIKSLSDDEIYDRMVSELRTDEFAWQAKARVAYKSKKMAEGLENVLYRCAKCSREYTQQTKGDTLSCTECGNTVRLNEYYDLIPTEGSTCPATIAEWYDIQLDELRKQIAADPDIAMHGHATLQETSDKAWLKPVGKGEITADRSGFTYKGDRNGEAFELKVPLNALPAIAFTPGKGFEMYYRGDFYSFALDNGAESQRWSSFIEMLHEAEFGSANRAEK